MHILSNLGKISPVNSGLYEAATRLGDFGAGGGDYGVGGKLLKPLLQLLQLLLQLFLRSDLL